MTVTPTLASATAPIAAIANGVPARCAEPDCGCVTTDHYPYYEPGPGWRARQLRRGSVHQPAPRRCHKCHERFIRREAARTHTDPPLDRP
jgi:hypothetical protein